MIGIHKGFTRKSRSSLNRINWGWYCMVSLCWVNSMYCTRREPWVKHIETTREFPAWRWIRRCASWSSLRITFISCFYISAASPNPPVSWQGQRISPRPVAFGFIGLDPELTHWKSSVAIRAVIHRWRYRPTPKDYEATRSIRNSLNISETGTHGIPQIYQVITI